MSERREQWGETAEERHARILARDLAWMTYAEACARDGVPRSERDHLIFNDGYAAGRADYLPAAGVVAEEPEWEYGWEADEARRAELRPRGPRIMLDDQPTTPEAIANFPRGRRIRRRKAGPWVPVKQEGAGQ